VKAMDCCFDYFNIDKTSLLERLLIKIKNILKKYVIQ